MKKLIMASVISSLLIGCGESDIKKELEQQVEQEVEALEAIPVGKVDGAKFSTENADKILALMTGYTNYLSNPLASVAAGADKARSVVSSTPCTLSGQMILESDTTGEVATSQLSYTKFTYDACLNKEIEIENYDNIPEMLTEGEIEISLTSYDNYSSFESKMSGDLKVSSNNEFLDTHYDIVLKGDADEYVADYKISVKSDQKGIDGELDISTTPTITWNANAQTVVGSVLIEGYINNTIRIVFDTNGTTYYVNDELYVPAS